MATDEQLWYGMASKPAKADPLAEARKKAREEEEAAAKAEEEEFKQKTADILRGPKAAAKSLAKSAAMIAADPMGANPEAAAEVVERGAEYLGKGYDYLKEKISPEEVAGPAAAMAAYPEYWKMSRADFDAMSWRQKGEVTRKHPEIVPLNQSVHEAIVRQAVREGKPVPASVLSDYPDLVRAAAPEAPRTTPEIAGSGRPSTWPQTYRNPDFMGIDEIDAKLERVRAGRPLFDSNSGLATQAEIDALLHARPKAIEQARQQGRDIRQFDPKPVITRHMLEARLDPEKRGGIISSGEPSALHRDSQGSGWVWSEGGWSRASVSDRPSQRQELEARRDRLQEVIRRTGAPDEQRRTRRGHLVLAAQEDPLALRPEMQYHAQTELDKVNKELAALAETEAPRAADTADHLADLGGSTPKLNPDGTITLYHRTTPEAANEIRRTGRFTPRENTREVFFSNQPQGQGSGYGTEIVEVRVNPKDVRLDDAFDNEIHVAVNQSVAETGLRAAAPEAPRAPEGWDRPRPFEINHQQGVGTDHWGNEVYLDYIDEVDIEGTRSTRRPVYYHVTLSENVTDIVNNGIRVGEGQNWQRATGEAHGAGRVHTFADYESARRWAHKMETAMFGDQVFSSPKGEVAIIAHSGGTWQTDPSVSPFEGGSALQKSEAVPPEQVIGYESYDRDQRGQRGPEIVWDSVDGRFDTADKRYRLADVERTLAPVATINAAMDEIRAPGSGHGDTIKRLGRGQLNDAQVQEVFDRWQKWALKERKLPGNIAAVDLIGILEEVRDAPQTPRTGRPKRGGQGTVGTIGGIAGLGIAGALAAQAARGTVPEEVRESGVEAFYRFKGGKPVEARELDPKSKAVQAFVENEEALQWALQNNRISEDAYKQLSSLRK